VNKIEQTVDKPRWDIGYTYCRWTVDELECIVDNIGLMEEKLDGLNSTTLDGQWKTKNIHFLTNQVNATRFKLVEKNLIYYKLPVQLYLVVRNNIRLSC